MALIRNLKKMSKERTRVHDVVDASYTVFYDSGKIIFQVDTYGRDDREFVGKVSQSIQFDKESAKMFIEKLKETFNLE